MALLLACQQALAIPAVAEAELALAGRLRQEATARLAVEVAAVAAAVRWRTDRARARLRLAERQAEAASELALRRRELAEGFVKLGSAALRDGRARLILAGLAQAAAKATAKSDQLGGEVAPLARQQRVAALATEIWSVRYAAAAATEAAAARRWRGALRSYAQALALGESGVKPVRAETQALVAIDKVTLALAKAPAWRESAPVAATDHKRIIPFDQRLDRRLLRSLPSSVRPLRPTRRLGAPSPSAGPVLPIAGRLLGGGASTLAIATSVGQVVSAPASGRVMFAEPFRGLGQLLIIDRGGGYHIVLTGLTRLDVRRGASVVAGQSVGEIVAREDGPARLQLELRHRGLPIDPAPWLAAYHDKVRS